MTHTCWPCRMTFEVRKPRKAEWSAEHTRCKECGQRFWHTGGAMPRTGIDPEDLPALEDIPA